MYEDFVYMFCCGGNHVIGPCHQHHFLVFHGNVEPGDKLYNILTRSADLVLI